MRNVIVDQRLDRITLGPTRRRRGNSFEGFERGIDRGHEDIVLSTEVSDDELGAAIREALRRCL